MINICFNITNPWSDTFKNLWCRTYHVGRDRMSEEIKHYFGVEL